MTESENILHDLIVFGDGDDFYLYLHKFSLC